MRRKRARIARAEDGALSAAQSELLNVFAPEVRDLGLFRTMLRSPGATKALLPWSNYIQSKNDLAPREKELVVLRTSFLCRSGYEWSHHWRLGRAAGLSEGEILALKGGNEGHVWSETDAALIGACDQLVRGHDIDEPTWRTLGRRFTEKQMMDLVFTVGQYTQMAMVVNAFGVQLDDGAFEDPDIALFEH
jgi:4-carboxymuconolactone decarboxylase